MNDSLGVSRNVRFVSNNNNRQLAIAIEPLHVPIHLGGSATLDEVVDYCCQIGPAARQLSIIDPALYSTGREAIRSVLEPFASEQGVWMDGAAWIVTAARSGTST